MTEGPAAASATIRNRSGIVWLAVVGVLVVFLLGDVALRGGLLQMALITPWLLIPVWTIVVFLVLPRLEVSRQGVIVRNPFRTTEFGWSRVDDISSRWQIGFRLVSGRSVQAFGAPLRRGRAATAADTDELDHVIALREAGHGDSGAPVSVRWNRGVLVSLAVLTAWAALATAIVAL